jgi:hypothetical protein
MSSISNVWRYEAHQREPVFVIPSLVSDRGAQRMDRPQRRDESQRSTQGTLFLVCADFKSCVFWKVCRLVDGHGWTRLSVRQKAQKRMSASN